MAELCENAAVGATRIIGGGCWNAKATQTVIVSYNHADKDVLRLCSKCGNAVAKDAKRHGYDVTIHGPFGVLRS